MRTSYNHKSVYEELDMRILDAIALDKHPLYDKRTDEEATRIAGTTGRQGFRVIDGRIQALRKAGKIRYLTKAESNGKCGWYAA